MDRTDQHAEERVGAEYIRLLGDGAYFFGSSHNLTLIRNSAYKKRDMNGHDFKYVSRPQLYGIQLRNGTRMRLPAF